MPTIQSNGINLYYEERGEGEPLLLIMGITAPGSVWEKHVDYWQKSFRCILVDNRGVGSSDKPPGPYSSAQMADDCAGLLHHLGINKARIAGVSMGSIIAQQLAIRHPELVRSMVLMCPWARCDNTARDIFTHMIDIKARLKPEEFAVYIQLLIFSKTSFDDPDMYHSMLEDRKNAALDPNPQPLIGLAGQAEACMHHDVLDLLSGIQQPVLVTGGEKDAFTPEWMTREVASAIPNSQLHIYPNSGHAFHWENLDDFNHRVRQWLAEN
ncbi:Pimeloyl-ACP methyl ester carboxylesterase [Cyclobacterium lianum]|uniref:Pimeloyl-ACP methyl ester carboxylesterase n=1 Tax=Cyclobacterium lianum TaxID=388280 RepID=A0A1M7KCP3_9BACT|nr:alpha/beta hydrolase [Cyclobacterium lianum]SHM62773.1 Pimeloyl-ACP methyl ester carboxylesterase [Cyclobacterium lianum]